MGYALIGIEGLAAAVFVMALSVRWAARGSRLRLLWGAALFLLAIAPAAMIVGAYFSDYESWRTVRTPWVIYAGVWIVVFLGQSAVVLRRGLKRPEPGLAREAASWSRSFLWTGLAGSLCASLFTFWNLDLAVRADLGLARQDAAAFIMSMSPSVPADSSNAADHYREAASMLGDAIDAAWMEAVEQAPLKRGSVDWKSPKLAEFLDRRQAAVARLREGAKQRFCRFENDRFEGEFVAWYTENRNEIYSVLRRGTALLAIDARVQSARGDLQEAFNDLEALFAMIHHAELFGVFWLRESMAWRTVEEVLALAARPADPLPDLKLPEPTPLIRRARQEQALLALVGPMVATEADPFAKQLARDGGPLDRILIERLLLPAARVFVLPDELAAMRKTFSASRNSPRSSNGEQPADWASFNASTHNDCMGPFGVYWIKPKQKKVAWDSSKLALLRALSQTGLAAARYRARHGDYPERVEALVGEFLDSVPVDPRDGRPLRMKRLTDAVVLYAAEDSKLVESGDYRTTDGRLVETVFRLPPGVKPNASVAPECYPTVKSSFVAGNVRISL